MNLIQTIKDAWGWVGIEPEEVVDENDFGNLLIRDTQGVFWRLSPEEVYCKVVARNRTELDSLFKNREFQANWHMQNLVKAAKEKLGSLPSGRKYHFAIPSILGGAYGISNFRTIPQIEQIHFSGDIGRQIKDLPDGTTVKLNIID